MGLASPVVLGPAVCGQVPPCLEPGDGALAQEPSGFGHSEQRPSYAGVLCLTQGPEARGLAPRQSGLLTRSLPQPHRSSFRRNWEGPGDTSLHRKRNHSCHLPLPVKSRVTRPSPLGDLGPCASPGCHGPSWAPAPACGSVLTSPGDCTPPSFSSLRPAWPGPFRSSRTVQPAAHPLPVEHAWGRKGPESLAAGPGAGADRRCDLEPAAAPRASGCPPGQAEALRGLSPPKGDGLGSCLGGEPVPPRWWRGRGSEPSWPGPGRGERPGVQSGWGRQPSCCLGSSPARD